MFSGNTSQVSADQLYVEDVFSTWLYTGNGGTQTITNGIDLAGKGGLVWIKARSLANQGSTQSTGVSGQLATGLTDATKTGNISYLSSGFSVNPGGWYSTNASGTTFASWTFREAPKFFDVVTYTGNGSFKRTLNHALGVAPGFIVVKRTDTTSNWWTYHRGVSGSINGYLNLTNSFTNSGYVEPGSILFSENPAAVFNVFNAGGGDDLNVNGATYVAYLFAHDATSDGVVQCGSFTTNASGAATVTLGWEPQWVMVKRTDSTGNWIIYDTMRGMPVGGYGTELYPNLSNAESLGFLPSPTATGFIANLPASATYIYIAIRRGPMKTPTLGTSVFSPITGSLASGSSQSVGFAADSTLAKWRTGTDSSQWYDRLRGYRTANTSAANYFLSTDSTNGESALNQTPAIYNVWNDTALTGGYFAGTSAVYYYFRRAPGFFDEVCYTGTGSYGTINHNLGVSPELIITKARSSGSEYWSVDRPNGDGKQGRLQSSAAWSTVWGPGNPVATSTTFAKCWDSPNVTYVAYLFASCPGVSKVGSYTGNGSSQTINCGFAAGARFVMIKRTDSAGDWYVWDTARGIVAANDPHLSLNTTAAEVTTDDTIDTDSSGFVVNQVAATNVNVSSATYIYLAIA